MLGQLLAHELAHALACRRRSSLIGPDVAKERGHISWCGGVRSVGTLLAITVYPVQSDRARADKSAWLTG
jgi:hypothetical protein